MSKPLLYGLLVVNILLLVGGQMMWKSALQNMNGLSIPNVLTSPGVYIGGLLYVIATGVWFVILNSGKFSIVYPLQSLAYVIGIVIAWGVFGETIPATRWIGAAVIIAGVYLITLE
jgi:uncharacterized membrane protein